MSPARQKVPFANTAASTRGAPRDVQTRHIANCLAADPAYGKGVADALDVALGKVATANSRR